jgi:hypothetical protein
MILWLEVDWTCARLLLTKRPGVTEHCSARSTGKATKGWATITALQFP